MQLGLVKSLIIVSYGRKTVLPDNRHWNEASGGATPGRARLNDLAAGKIHLHGLRRPAYCFAS